MVFVCLGVTASSHSMRWREKIVFDKATGRLKNIGWSDITWMLRPGSGVSLERLAATRNPFESIESPRHSENDIDAGGRLFREHCSSCHGDSGRGGNGGPSLYDHTFRQGRSDWAVYSTIKLGIPDTAMVGRNLPRDDIWRLVSYLRWAQESREASGSAAPPVAFEPVTATALRGADDDPAEWLMYSGSYASQRYSRLRQINADDIGQLRVEWQRQLSTTAEKVETSPIVRGSTMFVTEPPNRVLALDATSGRVLWTYSRDLPSQLLLCCGAVNRGVALLGTRVFVGTLDAHLVALEASTGKVLWDVEVADPANGYSITGAPLAVNGMILTGVAGGEFGIRGFVDAYDAASGQRRWRFYAVPGAGQPGSETWERG